MGVIPEPFEVAGRRLTRTNDRSALQPEVLARACGIWPGENGPRLIGFVAARRGEGTTTVTQRFARNLARLSASSVLLVDASPLPGGGGEGDDPSLAEALALSLPIGRAVTRFGDGLHRARLGAPEPRDEALGERPLDYPELWSMVRDAYPAVVVDLPALEQSDDAIALATHMDAVIVVVEAERTRVPVVARLVELLRRANAPVIGTVLNKRRYYIPRFIYDRL